MPSVDAMMTREERAAWVAQLRPGDKVGVYEGDRVDHFVHADVLARVTKQGRVRTAAGDLYNADGWVRRSGLYGDRHLGPLREEG